MSEQERCLFDLDGKFVTPYVSDIENLAKAQMDTVEHWAREDSGSILYSLAKAIYRTANELRKEMYAAQGLKD